MLSFDEADDTERLVEVKTTGLGKFHPFLVTANEVRCSEDVPEKFRLYRVFDFARSPRVCFAAFVYESGAVWMQQAFDAVRWGLTRPGALVQSARSTRLSTCCGRRKSLAGACRAG